MGRSGPDSPFRPFWGKGIEDIHTPFSSDVTEGLFAALYMSCEQIAQVCSDMQERADDLIVRGAIRYERAAGLKTRCPMAYRPRSLKNRFVYCNGVVDGTELQVGDAVVWLHGVSRSSDQKWMPARPLATA